MIDLYTALLNDEKYKELVKDLPEEEREIVDNQMKKFMDTLEMGIFNPLSTAFANKNIGKELRKIYSKKTLGDLIKRNG